MTQIEAARRSTHIFCTSCECLDLSVNKAFSLTIYTSANFINSPRYLLPCLISYEGQ